MTSSTKETPVANRSSDKKEGEGWWMASDRRWYPPELHPSFKKEAVATASPGAATVGASSTTAETSTAADVLGAGDIAIKQATPTPTVQKATAADVATEFVDEEEDPENPNFVAGVFAAAGAILTMIGSLLTWAKTTGMNATEIAPYKTTFSGFDSSGKGALFIAVFMLIFAALLIRGQRPGWVFGVLTFLCGAMIVGVVLYSYFDITGKASLLWQVALANNTDLSLAQIQEGGAGLGSSFGLWITAVGGLLGLLTPPFLRRDPVLDIEE